MLYKLSSIVSGCIFGFGLTVSSMTNPAKVIGWVSKTGERLIFDEKGIASCTKSDEKYQKINNLVSIVEK